MAVTVWAHLHHKTRWQSVFPVLATPTGELKLIKLTDPTQERGVMVPRRKRTRTQERQERIAAERQVNDDSSDAAMAVRRTRKAPTRT